MDHAAPVAAPAHHGLRGGGHLVRLPADRQNRQDRCGRHLVHGPHHRSEGGDAARRATLTLRPAALVRSRRVCHLHGLPFAGGPDPQRLAPAGDGAFRETNGRPGGRTHGLGGSRLVGMGRPAPLRRLDHPAHHRGGGQQQRRPRPLPCSGHELTERGGPARHRPALWGVVDHGLGHSTDLQWTTAAIELVATPVDRAGRFGHSPSPAGRGRYHPLPLADAAVGPVGAAPRQWAPLRAGRARHRGVGGDHRPHPHQIHPGAGRS